MCWQRILHMSYRGNGQWYPSRSSLALGAHNIVNIDLSDVQQSCCAIMSAFPIWRSSQQCSCIWMSHRGIAAKIQDVLQSVNEREHCGRHRQWPRVLRPSIPHILIGHRVRHCQLVHTCFLGRLGRLLWLYASGHAIQCLLGRVA